VSIQPGDLVTAADAPEGCPSWVGEVVRQDGGWGNCWWVQKLGHPVDTARGSDLRLLTDSEAVGLAEMLAGAAWATDGSDGAHIGGNAPCTDPSPYLWTGGKVWLFSQDNQGTDGRCHNIDHGKAAASRALILYTIRGQP
jgi:hypothetical protein